MSDFSHDILPLFFSPTLSLSFFPFLPSLSFLFHSMSISLSLSLYLSLSLSLSLSFFFFFFFFFFSLHYSLPFLHHLLNSLSLLFFPFLIPSPTLPSSTSFTPCYSLYPFFFCSISLSHSIKKNKRSEVKREKVTKKNVIILKFEATIHIGSKILENNFFLSVTYLY